MGKERNKKIIWVNGCFDILHVGHLRLLEYAKSKGDKLVVGIDSDERVRMLKGSNRPINNQEDRSELLRGLGCVDSVVVFKDEDEMMEKMKECEAYKMIVGEEYKYKRVIGEGLLEVEFFEKVPGHSSTFIINEFDELDEESVF